MSYLRHFFSPKTVAVVGASHDPNKLGTLILKNILESKEYAKAFPINIKGGTILGLQAYTNLREVPEDIDLAIVSVPARFVGQVILDAIAKRVKAVIVISAGFKETGKAGAKTEALISKMLKLARAKGVKIYMIGVNCLGVSSYETFPLNATFLPALPPDGNVAFISQSGAFGAAVIDTLRKNNLFGLKYFVSIGNKTDLSEYELFDYFSLQKGIKIIAGYLESIKNPLRFIKLVEVLVKRKGKHVVLLVPGISNTARKAAASHTGSMASDIEVLRLALQKAGAIIVSNITEMFNTIYILDKYGAIAGGKKRYMVITNAGGPGVITLDLFAKNKLELARLKPSTQIGLKESLPFGANTHGPVDVLGDADAQRYDIALKHVLADFNVDAAVVLLTPQVTTEPEKTAETILKYVNKPKFKPVYPVFIGGKVVEPAYNKYSKQLPMFNKPAELTDTLGILQNFNTDTPYRFNVNSIRFYPTINKGFLSLGKKICKYWQKTKTKRLNVELTEALLRLLHVSLPASTYIKLQPKKLATLKLGALKNEILAKLKQAVSQVKYPWVIKLANSDTLHATELKGVVANIRSKAQALDTILKFYNRFKTTDTLTIMVQEQVPIDVEVFVGFKNTNGIHTMLLGWGGIYTEILSDINKLVLPATKKEIKDALFKTKVAKVLFGARKGTVFDINLLVDNIFKLSALTTILPCYKTIDFNPIIVNKKGSFVVDFKVVDR